VRGHANTRWLGATIVTVDPLRLLRRCYTTHTRAHCTACCTHCRFDYCTVCDCLDPDATCQGVCAKPAYQGDGFCDDNNNNCGCDWDKGDCCGSSGKLKQYSYCTVCDCLDPLEGVTALPAL
jgi:hypothetical protein